MRHDPHQRMTAAPWARRLAFVALSAALPWAFGGCASVGPSVAVAAPPPLEGATPVDPAPAPGDPDWSEEGLASWYGEAFHGRLTASGDVYDMEALTAAHPSLPFGTRVLVENLATGARVDLRITDRGPYSPGRVIDVSRRAAEELGILVSGTATVRITVTDLP